MTGLGSIVRDRVNHAPLALQFIYGHRDERGENGDGNEGMRFMEDRRKSRDCLAFYIQSSEGEES